MIALAYQRLVLMKKSLRFQTRSPFEFRGPAQLQHLHDLLWPSAAEIPAACHRDHAACNQERSSKRQALGGFQQRARIES
jgi:hypothetical protein